MTRAEALLWMRLRAGRTGIKFVRQWPVAGCILDFAARDLRVAVEVDGDSHRATRAADDQRSARLALAGWSVVRIDNAEVFADPGRAASIVVAMVQAAASPSPRPSPLYASRGGEGEVQG